MISSTNLKVVVYESDFESDFTSVPDEVYVTKGFLPMNCLYVTLILSITAS